MVKPYQIKKGTCNLLDIYAEDLMIYLEMKQNQNFKKTQKWAGSTENFGIISKIVWT